MMYNASLFPRGSEQIDRFTPLLHDLTNSLPLNPLLEQSPRPEDELASVSQHSISFSQPSSHCAILHGSGKHPAGFGCIPLHGLPALNPEKADKGRIQKLSPQVRLDQWRGSFIIRASLEGHTWRLSFGLIAALLGKRELRMVLGVLWSSSEIASREHQGCLSGLRSDQQPA